MMEIAEMSQSQCNSGPKFLKRDDLKQALAQLPQNLYGNNQQSQRNKRIPGLEASIGPEAHLVIVVMILIFEVNLLTSIKIDIQADALIKGTIPMLVDFSPLLNKNSLNTLLQKTLVESAQLIPKIVLQRILNHRSNVQKANSTRYVAYCQYARDEKQAKLLEYFNILREPMMIY